MGKLRRDYRYEMNLKSQNVISSLGNNYGVRRFMPYAFTEQGIAMFSHIYVLLVPIYQMVYVHKVLWLSVNVFCFIPIFTGEINIIMTE